MKNEKIFTIIGAPHKLFTSSIVNNESNANRNRWIKEGRALDANHPPNHAKDLNQNPNPNSSSEKLPPNGRRRRIFDEYADFDNENSSPSFSITHTGGLAGLDISHTTDNENENEMANDNDFSSDTKNAYRSVMTAPITPSMAYGEATASQNRRIAPTLPTFTPINAPTTPTTPNAWLQTVMQQDSDSEMVDAPPKQKEHKSNNKTRAKTSSDEYDIFSTDEHMLTANPCRPSFTNHLEAHNPLRRDGCRHGLGRHVSRSAFAWGLSPRPFLECSKSC